MIRVATYVFSPLMELFYLFIFLVAAILGFPIWSKRDL
jgi:hypothetical protein